MINSSLIAEHASTIREDNLFRNWGQFAVLGILVCVVASLVIFPKAHRVDFKSQSFSVDEPGWIAASYYYTNLLRSGDLDWNKWDCPECGAGSSYGSLNMHVGEWLIGMPLEIDPATNGRPFLGYYDVNETLEKNMTLGQVPTADVLVRARFAPALFGVLCCLLMFSIGFWAYGPVAGVFSAALGILNPVLSKLSGQVMTDTFYNFFLLSFCLALIVLYKIRGKRKALSIVLLLGVINGLACSIKVTGILVGAGIFLVATAWRWYILRTGKREIAGWLAVFSVSSLLTVYLLNPLFWPSYRELNTKSLVAETRAVSSEIAAKKTFPWKTREAFLADGRYPQLRNVSHVLEFPLLFLRWQNMMQRQSARGWQGWDGPRLVSLNKTLVGLTVPAVLSSNGSVIVRFLASAAAAILILMGIIFLVRQAHRSKGQGMSGQSTIVPLMCFLVNYCLISAVMKLNWDRYYLPTILAAMPLMAVGFLAVFGPLYNYANRHRAAGLSRSDGESETMSKTSNLL